MEEGKPVFIIPEYIVIGDLPDGPGVSDKDLREAEAAYLHGRHADGFLDDAFDDDDFSDEDFQDDSFDDDDEDDFEDEDLDGLNDDDLF